MMLDELCPVQFIEGINECAKYDYYEDSISVGNYSAVAIEYNSNISYNIAGIDIFLFWSGVIGEKQCRVALQTDYNDKPSDIILSDGVIAPKVAPELTWEANWQHVDLSPARVIFHGKKYWVVINSDRLPFALGKAQEGAELVLMARTDTRWRLAGSNPMFRVMLRFYGRVLPIVS